MDIDDLAADDVQFSAEAMHALKGDLLTVLERHAAPHVAAGSVEFAEDLSIGTLFALGSELMVAAIDSNAARRPRYQGMVGEVARRIADGAGRTH
jgi:hypothetical protein